jgi:hypothetical protein
VDKKEFPQKSRLIFWWGGFLFSEYCRVYLATVDP